MNKAHLGMTMSELMNCINSPVVNIQRVNITHDSTYWGTADITRGELTIIKPAILLPKVVNNGAWQYVSVINVTNENGMSVLFDTIENDTTILVILGKQMNCSLLVYCKGG